MASISILKGILCGIALACCALTLSSCDTSSSDTAHRFPKKIATRIVLRPDSTAEEIRYVYMAEDGITKPLTQIEYKNGVTSYTSGCTYTRLTVEMNEEGTAAQWLESVTVIYSSSDLGEKQNLRTRTVKLLCPYGSVAFVKQYNQDILLCERAGTNADRVDIKALISKLAFECLPIPTKAERYRAHSSFI